MPLLPRMWILQRALLRSHQRAVLRLARPAALCGRRVWSPRDGASGSRLPFVQLRLGNSLVASDGVGQLFVLVSRPGLFAERRKAPRALSDDLPPDRHDAARLLLQLRAELAAAAVVGDTQAAIASQMKKRDRPLAGPVFRFFGLSDVVAIGAEEEQFVVVERGVGGSDVYGGRRIPAEDAHKFLEGQRVIRPRGGKVHGCRGAG